MLDIARCTGGESLVDLSATVVQEMQVAYMETMVTAGLRPVSEPAIIIEYCSCPSVKDPGGDPFKPEEGKKDDQKDGQKENRPSPAKVYVSSAAYDPLSSLRAWEEREKKCVQAVIDLRGPGENGQKNGATVAKGMMNMLWAQPWRLATGDIPAAEVLELTTQLCNQDTKAKLFMCTQELKTPDLMTSGLSPATTKLLLEDVRFAFKGGGLQVPIKKATLRGSNDFSNFTEMLRIVCYVSELDWVNTYLAVRAFQSWSSAYEKLMERSLSKNATVTTYDLREFHNNPRYAVASFWLKQLGIPQLIQCGRRLMERQSEPEQGPI